MSNKDGKVKTLQEFRQFLDQRATALEAVQKLQSKSVSPKERPKETSNGQSYATTSKECPVCKQSHRIYFCPKFTSSEVSVRRETAKELRLCFNCLATVTQSGIVHRKQSAAHVVRNITHYYMTRV